MEFLVLLAVLYLVSVPGAIFMALGNRKDNQRTRMDLGDLNQRLNKFDGKLRSLEELLARRSASPSGAEAPAGDKPKANTPVTETTAAVDPPPPTLTEEPRQPVPAEPIPDPSNTQAQGKDGTVDRPAIAAARTATATPKATQTKSGEVPNRGFRDMEDNLSSKWMIWIGGIALALGGGFLVKYSIDAGLLAPSVRITLGTLFGLLLLVVGETVRRRSKEITWLQTAPDYLPSAISAAGLFTLFASLYSAHALYALFPAFWAFVMLATVSALALLLARVHGKFFAYLGMVAGMTIPLLVSTGGSSAWELFPYLLFVSGTTLYVAREKGWSDVAGYSLLTAVSWVFLWIIGNWHVGDILPVGLYLLIIGGLNSWLLSGASPSQSSVSDWTGIFPAHAVSRISAAVTLVTFLLLAGMVRLEHFSTISLVIFGSALIGQVALAFRDAEHDLGALSAIAASLFLLATWHVPNLVEIQHLLNTPEAVHMAIAPIAPPGFETFVIACVLFGGAFGFGIYYALPSRLRTNMWAVVGAAYPLAVQVLAYGRLNDFETSVPFSAIALGMAALLAGAVTALNKQEADRYRTPVAAYVAAATTAIAVAITMLLRDAWLTTALAFELVALAHIWRKIPIKGLRTLALGLGSIVLVRLFLNSAIFEYGAGDPLPVINWLFYGYGLTALMFAYAARVFGEQQPGDPLISLLKAGGALLAIAFVTLEFRVLFGENGHLHAGLTSTEAAMQTLNWSVATTILMWRETRDGNKLFGILRKGMTLVSLFGLFILGGMFNNILFTYVEVGSWPILNLQLVQFLVPGLLCAFKARMAEIEGSGASHKLYGIIALVTLFLWVTVEVRHLFHPSGGGAAASDWEWYSYSAAWLLYAACLIAVGIKLAEAKIRMAGLAVLGFVILKVFLFDMGNLDGIARALSFMGLGAALIGLGYLYQYFKREGPNEEEQLDRSNQFRL